MNLLLQKRFRRSARRSDRRIPVAALLRTRSLLQRHDAARPAKTQPKKDSDMVLGRLG